MTEATTTTTTTMASTTTTTTTSSSPNSSSIGAALSTPNSSVEVLEKARDCLTCSICLERYREPKALPCLHSFCRKCLEEVVKATTTSAMLGPSFYHSNLHPPFLRRILDSIASYHHNSPYVVRTIAGTSLTSSTTVSSSSSSPPFWHNPMEPSSITCPECRAVAKIPSGGVAAFPTNFFINKMVELLTGEPQSAMATTTTTSATVVPPTTKPLSQEEPSNINNRYNLPTISDKSSPVINLMFDESSNTRPFATTSVGTRYCPIELDDDAPVPTNNILNSTTESHIIPPFNPADLLDIEDATFPSWRLLELTSQIQRGTLVAHGFASRVRRNLNRSEYQQLRGVLRELNSGEITMQAFVKHAVLIFRNHKGLLLKFRNFIPAEYRSLYEEEVNRTTQTSSALSQSSSPPHPSFITLSPPTPLVSNNTIASLLSTNSTVDLSTPTSTSDQSLQKKVIVIDDADDSDADGDYNDYYSSEDEEEYDEEDDQDDDDEDGGNPKREATNSMDKRDMSSFFPTKEADDAPEPSGISQFFEFFTEIDF